MNALKGWKSILMIPNDIENSVYDDDDGNIQRGVMPVEAAVRLSSERGVGRRLYSSWRPLPPAQEAATAPVQVGPRELSEGRPWILQWQLGSCGQL